MDRYATPHVTLLSTWWKNVKATRRRISFFAVRFGTIRVTGILKLMDLIPVFCFPIRRGRWKFWEPTAEKTAAVEEIWQEARSFRSSTVPRVEESVATLPWCSSGVSTIFWETLKTQFAEWSVILLALKEYGPFIQELFKDRRFSLWPTLERAAVFRLQVHSTSAEYHKC